MDQTQWQIHLDVAISLVLLWFTYHRFNLAIESDDLRSSFYWSFFIPTALWSGPAFQTQVSEDFIPFLNAVFFASLPMSCFYLTIGSVLIFESLRSKRAHFWRLFYASFLSAIPALSFAMFVFRSQVEFLPEEYKRFESMQQERSVQPRQRPSE